MSTVLFIIFVIVTAFLFAKVEIAVEGAHGWAENLPTWRLPREHWISRLCFANKPATGYHVWMFLFLFFYAHIIYLFSAFAWSSELKIISFFILFMTVEDFLWFVLNPAYGLKKFRANDIWWHRNNWWGIAPRDYFFSIPAGILIYLVSTLIR